MTCSRLHGLLHGPNSFPRFCPRHLACPAAETPIDNTCLPVSLPQPSVRRGRLFRQIFVLVAFRCILSL